MIGDQIKKFRTKQGMTQQNLADKLFVTAQAVSRWENGEVEPSLSTITNMAKIFGVSTDEMLGIDPVEKTEEVSAPEKEDVPTETVEKMEERPITEQPQGPSLGICEKCKRPIYKQEEIVIKHYGRNSPQHIYCIQCEEKAKEQHRLAMIYLAAKRKKRSFILGGLGAAVVLGIMIAVLLNFYNPAVIAATVILPIATFTLISCLILNNNFIWEMIFWITSHSVQMPGVIFSLDLDGIIWLLTVKLGLFLLSVAISIALFLLAIALGLVVSVFVYPFALVKNINHPEDQEEC